MIGSLSVISFEEPRNSSIHQYTFLAIYVNYVNMSNWKRSCRLELDRTPRFFVKRLAKPHGQILLTFCKTEI